jgi:hypothetical protein
MSTHPAPFSLELSHRPLCPLRLHPKLSVTSQEHAGRSDCPTWEKLAEVTERGRCQTMEALKITERGN